MMAHLIHRGPDAGGYYVDDQVVLGHTRLAIVDTDNGLQPMCNEDSLVWVTFNGEIFNHVELREQLRDRGHRFRTRCDTEVIVHAWEEWGPGSFDRFNGQWALALWDRRTEELVLCRDRYGVRPLYYTRDGDQLRFASEITALLAASGAGAELDPAGMDQILTFWAPLAPTTPFLGVRQVPPGCYLRLVGGRETTSRYWSPGFPEAGPADQASEEEHAGALRESLINAVRLRFERSDVPVGAYLSGGIDSSVTAALIASFTDVEVDTFSVRFDSAEHDEGRYQRLLTDSLGTRHHEVRVSGRDIAEVFPEVVRHAEHPLLRTAPAPMFLLSRLVHECGYKVVVTGEGADEVLAGYDLFLEAKVRQRWGADPDPAARQRAVAGLYPWMTRSPARAPAFAAAFFGRNLDLADPAMSHRPRWDTTAMIKPMLADRMRVESTAADDLIARMPPRQRAVGDAGARPVARDDHSAARLHPGFSGRPDADGQLGRRAVPLPRRRCRPTGRIAAGRAEDRGPRREASAQTGLRRSGAPGDSDAAQAALPLPRRRELLRRRSPRLGRRRDL